MSKELGVDIKVETDLHEWIPDASYKYLNDEDSYNSFKEFCMNRGIKNENCKYNFETVDSIKNRVNSVLDKYKKYNKVIVVSHGVVIQCFLDVMELNNGQVEEYDLK